MDVTVKSFMHANGDLVILGEDDQNNNTFLLVIKADKARATMLDSGKDSEKNTT